MANLARVRFSVMGVLGLLKLRFCERRKPTASPTFCPISGQTNSAGVCPISGNGLAAAASKEKLVQQSEKEPLKADVPSVAGADDPPLDEDRAIELKELGNVYFRKQEYEAAVDAYTQALELQAKEPLVRLNRSIALRQLKRWAEALQDAELVAAAEPSNVKAYYGVALALKELGQLCKAREACESGLKVQSDHKALLELREAIAVAAVVEVSAPAAKPAAAAPEAQGVTVSPKASAGVASEAKPEGSARQQPPAAKEASSPKAASKAAGATAAGKAKAQGKAKVKAAAKRGSDAANAISPQAACPASPKLEVLDKDAGKCPASGFDDLKLEAKQHALQAAYQWKGRNPSPGERFGLKETMVGIFLEKYKELKQKAAELDKRGGSVLQTDQYGIEEKNGLQIKGGHRPMKRPTNIELPEDYMEMVGHMTPEELTTHDCNNPGRRYFISVWGDIFDVSDRPDKYGPDGPYNFLTGRDITWGLFTGIDTADFCDKYYDLHKAKDMGKDKLAGICSWIAWYTTEYGQPVGRLLPWEDEELLPAPPLDQVDDACAIM